MRTRVLWLVKGLGPGGAERLLIEHARFGDQKRFAYETAYLLPWKQHLVPELERLGVPTHCLDVRSPADPRWLARLRGLVRDRCFDVVHIHSPALAAPARLVLRLDRRRPALVYTEHNRWPSHHPVTRLANRVTIGLTDVTVAVSEDVRRSMGAQGEQAQVITHGVDTASLRELRSSREAVRAELGVDDGQLLAVTVANLRVGKGYRTLLDAARIVEESQMPVRFVAAGQGPQEDELRARIAELGLGDRFRLLGYVPNAARLVAGADLFVLASDHEGLPLAVMEALALGVPVVATRVGGVPELVEDGTSGRLVPPRDSIALAEAVIDLADSPTREVLAAGAEKRGRSVDGRAAVARVDDLYMAAVCGPA